MLSDTRLFHPGRARSSIRHSGTARLTMRRRSPHRLLAVERASLLLSRAISASAVQSRSSTSFTGTSTGAGGWLRGVARLDSSRLRWLNCRTPRLLSTVSLAAVAQLAAAVTATAPRRLAVCRSRRIALASLGPFSLPSASSASVRRLRHCTSAVDTHLLLAEEGGLPCARCDDASWLLCPAQALDKAHGVLRPRFKPIPLVGGRGHVRCLQVFPMARHRRWPC